MTDVDGRRALLTYRWSLTAAAAGAAMVLTFVAITLFGGSSGAPVKTVVSDPSTGQPLSSSSLGNDADNHSADDGSTAERPASTGSTPSEAEAEPIPRPAPTTWAQEVAAAGPNDNIRLTPAASDWIAENIVIGKDLAGKFLGRVTVRYSGPGAAAGKFAVTLLKDGREITTLTGELAEVRSGVYQVMLSTAAAWVEGPWTTEFRVLSTT